jgi:hypothetical protein
VVGFAEDGGDEEICRWFFIFFCCAADAKQVRTESGTSQNGAEDSKSCLCCNEATVDKMVIEIGKKNFYHDFIFNST